MNLGIFPFSCISVQSPSKWITIVMISDATTSDKCLTMDSGKISNLVMNITIGNRMIGNHYFFSLSDL